MIHCIRVLIASALGFIAVVTMTTAQEQYQYDAAGRLTRVTYDDGASIAYSYDRNGNIISTASRGTSKVAVEKSGPSLRLAVVTGSTLSDLAIIYETPTVARIEIAVIDITGNIVARLQDELLPAGEYRRELDSRMFASGIYLVRMRGGGETVSTRFTVVK